MGISIEPPGPEGPGAAQASLVNFSQVTSPGVAANLASIVAPPLGVYDLLAYIALSGAAGAADQDNINLRVNGATLTRLPLQASVASSNEGNPIHLTVRVTSVNITLQTIGAGAVGAVYTTLLVATLVGS